MTHPRNAPPAGADAERAAFLRDLRALRDQAGLQTRDLAARAHYPEDTLKTAEDGPALPSLPVLEAYVRGCGARPSDWEDRWRRLTLPEEAELGSALPTRAPTANRLPTRGASAGPVGLSAAEQAALAPGLARVAAGLGPTTVAADPGSWFARPDMAASGSAAGPSASAPSAPYAPSAPSEQDRSWPPATDSGTAWPATDSGTAWPATDSGTAWPATDSGTAWPATDSGTAWPTRRTRLTCHRSAAQATSRIPGPAERAGAACGPAERGPAERGPAERGPARCAPAGRRGSGGRIWRPRPGAKVRGAAERIATPGHAGARPPACTTGHDRDHALAGGAPGRRGRSMAGAGVLTTPS